ncbi:gamma-glutamyltranspeptidase 1-like [Limulus polyphemus]|uniref:Gamma-glutamyltranspeptidase 1-like n=1 Tax=Limulus polyphemus TaxID=6850 RepID=A0ABM1RVZ1_LIMPO|nr:gamma-glutamyltranspeptidase 1-like [Limulus polyphemus]
MIRMETIARFQNLLENIFITYFANYFRPTNQSIYLRFGSKRRSSSTGIILNNEMDDFSSPNIINSFGLLPSPSNFIEPGKRPLSSMSPSVILDKDGDLKAVIGGAGGSRIITAVAQVLMRSMWLSENVKQAIDALRLHHQQYPNTLFYEEQFPQVRFSSSFLYVLLSPIFLSITVWCSNSF